MRLSVLGWNNSRNDSRGIILYWEETTPETTPEEAFNPGIVQIKGNHSVLYKNDSRGVILSQDTTAPGESFCPGIERL